MWIHEIEGDDHLKIKYIRKMKINNWESNKGRTIIHTREWILKEFNKLEIGMWVFEKLTIFKTEHNW